MGLAEHTSVDWYHLHREIYEEIIMNKSEAIGGYGKRVQIDESKFGKRKYHRGHRIEGQWVFGGIEEGTRRNFMVCVEKRDAATLIPLIERSVLVTFLTLQIHACCYFLSSNHHSFTCLLFRNDFSSTGTTFTWFYPCFKSRQINTIDHTHIKFSQADDTFVHIFFYRQLNFSSQPGVANEFCENEAENCLVVAYFYS